MRPRRCRQLKRLLLKVTAKPDQQIHSQLDNAGLAAFLAKLTTISRPIIGKWFRALNEIEIKSDATPVTIADKSVELALREAIATRFPGDDILGEEHDVTRGDGSTGYQWVIDPIDGTKAFVCGKQAFGTLVGLLRDNEPVAGLCDMPMLDEAYVGVGQQAWMNRQAIAPSIVKNLCEARLATTSPAAFSAKGLELFNRVSKETRMTSYGGDCHNYALLAAGYLDLVIEDSLAPHDIMGVVPVMTGAGAVVSDLAGNPVRFPETTSLLCAATAELHDAALAIINHTS